MWATQWSMFRPNGLTCTLYAAAARGTNRDRTPGAPGSATKSPGRRCAGYVASHKRCRPRLLRYDFSKYLTQLLITTIHAYPGSVVQQLCKDVLVETPCILRWYHC